MFVEDHEIGVNPKRFKTSSPRRKAILFAEHPFSHKRPLRVELNFNCTCFILFCVGCMHAYRFCRNHQKAENSIAAYMSDLIGLIYVPLVLAKIFLTALLAITIGAPYRKYRNNVLIAINLKLTDALFALPYQYLQYAIPASVEKLLSLNKRRFAKLLGPIPGYNTSIDTHSRWLVRPKHATPDDPIMLYFHGGGYLLQTTPLLLSGLTTVYRLVEPNKRSRLSIGVLDYDLVLAGFLYPHQLNQAYETYQFLVDSGNRNICLLGDSAGGNLVIALLQYLKEKQSSVFPTSAILLSPWVKLLATPDDFVHGHLAHDNDPLDCIRYLFASNKEINDAIVGQAPLNQLTVSPGNCRYQAGDWHGIPTFNSPNFHVLVLAGEDELFRDDVLEWCYHALEVPLFKEFRYGDSNGKYLPEKHHYSRRNEPGRANVSVYIEPWGVHDPFILTEGGAFDELANNPSLTLRGLNKNRYFVTLRIAEFLNETIE